MKAPSTNASVLGGTQRRWLLALAFGAVVTAVVAAAGAVLASVLADAALDLSDTTRVVLPWAVGVGALAVLAIGLASLRRLRQLRMARLLERRDPALGNALTNAVQLADVMTASAVGEVLRQEAVERGCSTAMGVKLWPVLKRRMLVVLLLVAGVASAWCVMWTAGGEVLREVWPRFVDPHGDHPPFSRVKFDVRPGPATVLYGGQVEVRTTVRGGAVEKLFVVARGAGEPTRAAMFLATDRTYFQTLANLREDTEYYVTDGRARSHRFKIGVKLTPKIAGVKVVAHWPEYTGREAQTAELGDEELRLPLDSRVAFRVSSNRPLKGGTLTVTPLLGGKQQVVELKGNGTNGTDRTSEKRNVYTVSGELPVTEAVVFALTVTDVDGLASAEQRQGRIQILPDKRPQIFVLEPGRNAVATPATRIPVKVEAVDDFGVTRVMWFRGHNKSIERPFTMKLAARGGPAIVAADGAFALAELGVKPGDVIDYFFEAVDNYPHGPNVVASRMYSVRIISEEQYREALRKMAARKALFDAYQRLVNWLQRMQERANTLAQSARTAEERGEMAKAAELRKGAEALAENAQQWREELKKLMGQQELFDLEEALRAALAEQNERVGKAIRKLQMEAAGSGLVKAETMREVAELLGNAAKEAQEKVSEPLRHLASVVKVLAQADRFTKLAEQQAQLAQMLRRFQERAGELSRVEQMEVQELASAQRRIEEELRDLTGKLPELLQQVPADAAYDKLRASVNGFLEAINELKISADLKASKDRLAEMNARDAFGHALTAAENMDKLVSKCAGLQGEASQCLSFQPQLKKAMGQSLEQIMAALGAGNQGEGGRDGYSLFNEEMGLYGPDAELAGEQTEGRGPDTGAGASRSERVAGDARDPGLNVPEATVRVPLQHDVKFPLRYRNLVGEYFRAIAEEQGK